jgi:hypothetical protein
MQREFHSSPCTEYAEVVVFWGTMKAVYSEGNGIVIPELKQVLRHEDVLGSRGYHSTQFLTSALAGDELLASRSSRFTSLERVWTRWRKHTIADPVGIWTPVVQPVA